MKGEGGTTNDSRLCTKKPGGYERRLRAPRHPAHLPAELALDQIHTEARAHQPQTDDCDTAVR